MIIWFTGQPGSGKTTLAREFASFLSEENSNSVTVIDGDYLRKHLLPLGFGTTDRQKNVDRAQAIAAFYNSVGEDTCVAVVAPYRDQRERFKKFMGKDMLEVHVHGDSTYKIEYHVKDYQPPLENFLDIDTGAFIPTKNIMQIINREIRSLHR